MAGNVMMMVVGVLTAVAIVISVVFITPLLLAVVIAAVIAAVFLAVVGTLRQSARGEQTGAGGSGRGPASESREPGDRPGTPASGEGME